MANHAIIGFNSGILSPKVDTRFDVSKYGRGCRVLQNMIPTKYGSAERRPGLVHINDVYNSASIARVMEFIYSASIAYKVEMTDSAFRFYYEDDILEDVFTNEVVVTTPYEEEDLFLLQSDQLGDIMWLVHPSFRPATLSRTDPYTFELEDIQFTGGPFLTRNDLVDLTNTSPTEMRCTVTEVGDVGLLIATAGVFDSGHKDALFKLIHPRENTIVERSGAGTSTILPGKGTFSFVTRGTWTGTVRIQRRDNGSDWENFRTYVSNNNRNIIESWKEEDENIEYRINAESGMSNAFRSDLSIKEPSQEGIVRITGVGSSTSATCEVLTVLSETGNTKRWHEGSWSTTRGWPSAVCFFEERSVYAGSTTGSIESTNQLKDYPNLINITV